MKQGEIESNQACYSSDDAEGIEAFAFDATPAEGGMACNAHLLWSKGWLSTAANVDIRSSEVANANIDAAFSAL